MHHFVLPALWGLLAFASWIGWGRLVGWWIDPTRHFEAGVCAGWGLALVVTVGGLLNATWCCGYTATILLIAGGCVSLFWLNFPAFLARPQWRLHLRDWPLVLLMGGMIFIYGASICWLSCWNAIDDYSTYSTWPMKMLGAGAAIDPFSMRRLSSFGGYAFVQTVASPFSWPASGFLVDIGLGGLGLSLVVATFLRKRGELPILCASAALGMLELPIVRINSMCTMLPVFLTVVLYLTLQLRDDIGASSRRRVLIVSAMVCGALIAFRPVYIPFTAMTFGFAELIRLLQKKDHWRTLASDSSTMFAATVLFLIPWSLSLYFATNSPLWPVINGNYNRNVNFNNAYLPLGPLIGFVIELLIQPYSLVAMASVLLVVRTRLAEPSAMLIAAMITTIITAANFTLSNSEDLSRYTLPMLAGAAIAAMLSTQLLPQDSKRRRTGRFALVLWSGLILAQFFSSDNIHDAYLGSWQDGVLHGIESTPQLADNYFAAQERVPAGATILTLTAYAYNFNYRRNPIYSLDWAGMASPRPGLPLGQGPDAWLKYLRSQSIDYLICDDFDKLPKLSLSNRLFMWMRLHMDPNYDVRVPTDQRIMPTVMSTMDDIDELKKADPPIFHSGAMFVLAITDRRKAT